MRSIFLFTHSYPYCNGEDNFLSDEIEIVSREKIDLTIIPLKKKDKFYRELPDGIKLNTTLSETSSFKKFIIFIEMFLSSLFWKIPFQGKHSPRSPRQYYYAVKYLYGSFIIRYFILSNRSLIPDNSIIYSYWFNHTSLGAVLAKLCCPSFSFKIITRGHGFDVFEDKVGKYFPYRQLNLKYIDQVYTVSNAGKYFLEKKYPGFKNKISISRLGTRPIKHNLAKIKGDTLSFLSCSSIIPIKRVELIFNSILAYATENPHKIIKWTHFGSGQGFNDLKNIIKRKSRENFFPELKGFVDNKDVREFLAKERFDVFINLSINEGVPVSIMEAISVGIPVVATDVGGNNEIVTSETGLLLKPSFTKNSFILAVNEIVAKGDSLRVSASNFYERNFNAEVNYSTFYKNILNKY